MVSGSFVLPVLAWPMIRVSFSFILFVLLEDLSLFTSVGVVFGMVLALKIWIMLDGVS